MRKIFETHRIVIRTAFYGPTNHKGSRIRATCGKGKPSLWFKCDPILNDEQNHDAAALALCAQQGWEHEMVKGSFDYDHLYMLLPRKCVVAVR